MGQYRDSAASPSRLLQAMLACAVLLQQARLARELGAAQSLHLAGKTGHIAVGIAKRVDCCIAAHAWLAGRPMAA